MGLKILLVDDVKENLFSLQALLAEEDVELILSQSGNEALHILLEQEIDLAILDIMMPDMDGFELAELMRGFERTKNIPIIFLTAASQTSNFEFKGYEYGAVDFLFKPVNPVILKFKVAAFRRLVEHKHLLAEKIRELEILKAEEKDARIKAQMAVVSIQNERENFRNLFRQTPEMVCLLSGSNHTFEFVNDSHIRSLGFDASGMTFTQAQPESSNILKVLDQVYATGVAAELKEVPITLNGQICYFNLTFAAKRNVSGQIDGVMMLGAEITEQVLIREVMKSKKLALESTLNGSSLKSVLEGLASSIEIITGSNVIAAIMLIDSQGKHLLHAAAPSLPVEYSEIVNGIAIGPNAGSCGTAAYYGKTVIASDISQDPAWAHYKDVALEFGLKACWSRPFFSSQGKLLGTFALYRKQVSNPTPQDEQIVDLVTHTVSLVVERHLEVQERHVAESALRRSQEQLSLAVNVSGLGFYDWDLEKSKLTLSDKMRKDWGLDNSDEFDSFQDLLKRIHPDDQSETENVIGEALRRQIPFEVECRVLQDDKPFIWVELRGQIHYNENLEATRFFGTSVDISERKQVQNELLKAKEASEAGNQAKSAFLANMSHEIRTPLGVIMGFTELLAQPFLKPDEAQKYISIVNRNSSLLLRIIDDILDLSKVEAGKLVIENRDFSLLELLSDFKAMMFLRAEEKGIDFDLKVATTLPSFIHSDSTRIRQILMNVVGNAIKFTEKGTVELLVSEKMGQLEFRVKDTGRGISKEQAKNLFQPFMQADPTTTRRYGGTGLGLVLTKKLCEALGGEFYLESSELDQGSTFVATIANQAMSHVMENDFQNLKSLSTPTTKEDRAKTLSGMKVLLVEDSPDNQELIGFMLSSEGISVDMANDGEAGVQQALAGDYTIVLMDVQMPKMDGHGAMKELKRQGYKTPVVALTAHAMKEEKQRCLESGFTAFLSKPVQREEMLQMIRELNA